MNKLYRTIVIASFLLVQLVACSSESITQAIENNREMDTQETREKSTSAETLDDPANQSTSTASHQSQDYLGTSSSELLVAWDADLFLLNTSSGDLNNLTNSTEREGFAMWSPDGSMVALSSTSGIGGGFDHVEILRLDGSKTQNVLIPNAIQPFWSPDGRMLVLGAATGEYSNCLVVDVGGSLLATIKGLYGSVSDCVWSPDGKHILVQDYDTNTRKFTLLSTDDQGKSMHSILSDYTTARGAFWKSNIDNLCESYIVFPSIDRFRLIEVSSMRTVDISANFPLELTRSDPFLISLSPDCKRVAFPLIEEGASGIYVMDLDGSNVEQIINDRPVVFFEPIWSPDGNRLALVSLDLGSFDREIFIVNADGTELRKIVGPLPVLRSTMLGNDFICGWRP